MENRINFGTWETIALLTNTICARVFLNHPRPLLESAGTAGWIEMLYAAILALLAFMIIEKLYLPFEGKDIIDICELYIGNIGRIIVGMLITLLLLYIASVILREYAENMKVIALPSTPISFVTSFFLAGMICGAYLGIEAIVRFHSLAVPVVAVTFLILIVSVAPYYDATNLFPILGNGAGRIFGDGFLKISLFAPLLYLFLMPPFIKSHKNFKRSGYVALMLCSILLMISTLVYSLVYPYPTNLESFLPMFQLARLINFGRFFQRIESVFMLAWAATAMMYLSVILFFMAYAFKKSFRLEYYRPLIFPFAAITYTLGLMPPNLMTAIDLETRYYSYFSWVITFVVTILVLFIARIRKKGEGEKNEI